MSEEGFTVLAKEVTELVNAGESEKARCVIARLAIAEYGRGAAERRVELHDILASAVVAMDAGDFVKGLIAQAKLAGLTEDGLTLTSEGQMVVGVTRAI